MSQKLTPTQIWGADSSTRIASPNRLHAAFERVRSLEGAPALPFILGSKLATLALIVIAVLNFPINETQQAENFAYPVQSGLAERLTPWDASHYLHLSDEGYKPDQMSNAFAPLYPWLVKIAHVAVPDRVLAALLVANIASAIGLYLLFVYCKWRYGEGAALKTLLVLLAFPTAFYLNIIYSEAVFLLLTVLFFWGLYTRSLLLAAVAAFLLPLARSVGFVVIVPLGLYLATEALSQTRGAPWPERLRGLIQSRMLYVLAPVLGLVAYMAYMQATTGDPLAMIHAQKLFPASMRGFDDLLSDPTRIVEDFLTVKLAFHDGSGSILDRLFFVWFVASLPLAYRKLDRPLFVFALLMGLTPVAGSFMSYMRYVLVAVPLFIAWGRFLDGKSPRLVFYGLMPLVVLQETFVVLYAMYNGVA